MKKCILLLMTVFSIRSIYGIEIRTNCIISGFNKRAAFWTYSVKDLFYTNQNELLIKVNKESVFFLIDENNYIAEIDEETYLEKMKERFDYTAELKYSYYLNISQELNAFDDSRIEISDDFYKPVPMFMYINNKKDEIVFNFNQWKLKHKEYYPKSYYNSLSEEIFYTEEKRDRIMKLNAVYTVKNLYCINPKENKIAIILDNYNSEGFGALIIFDVLYNATVNDFRVRLRSEPNLKSQVLSYFYEGDKVRILDQSDEPYEIDGESHYWYKIESGTYPIGWLYGKYLDIEG